jgi:hypothetical protein
MVIDRQWNQCTSESSEHDHNASAKVAAKLQLKRPRRNKRCHPPRRENGIPFLCLRSSSRIPAKTLPLRSTHRIRFNSQNDTAFRTPSPFVLEHYVGDVHRSLANGTSRGSMLFGQSDRKIDRNVVCARASSSWSKGEPRHYCHLDVGISLRVHGTHRLCR